MNTFLSAEDTVLMWEGILSTDGKTVLETCEKDFHCFISTSKHGPSKTPSVKQ